MTQQGKLRASLVVIALLVIALVALLVKFVVIGSTLPAQDGRIVVALDPGERALMLREMRGFVDALQRITDGLARGDSKEVSEAARAVGVAAAHNAPVTMLGKLPLEFKRLAFGVHGGFDQLATDAANGAPREQSLKELSTILGGCVACHASYQAAAPAASR
ncbi:MAG: hypothetical protein JSS46_11870 [Proteobacteria bacterium]|nr:hypothetical protein [Pseudomonadota bacterium]